MKKFIIISLLCCITKLHAQVQVNTRLALMQGIWEWITNDDTNSVFKVVNGNKCLEFAFEKVSNDLEFPLFEMIIGFQNTATFDNEIWHINIDSLKEDGLYYTEVINKKYIERNGMINKAYCVIPSYYECDGNILSINGGKLFEYEKIKKLSNNSLKKLYNRGKLDKRDYIKDYLNIKVMEITAFNGIIYSEPNKPTNIQLSKGDIVTVLEEKGKWLKVDYGTDQPGWIKRKMK
jgi:hypothetical protein